MARRTPASKSVTLTTAGVKYNLGTLLAAVMPSLAANQTMRCEALQIQNSVTNGGGFLYVGDPDNVSATDCGVELTATQAVTIQSMGSNTILLTDVGLTGSSNTMQVNVMIFTR